MLSCFLGKQLLRVQFDLTSWCFQKVFDDLVIALFILHSLSVADEVAPNLVESTGRIKIDSFPRPAGYKGAKISYVGRR